MKHSSSPVSTIAFPPLLAWQEQVRKSKARFKVVNVGRRAGKTYLACLIAFLTAYEGGHVWWLAPTHDMAGAGWQQLKQIANLVNDATYSSIEQRQIEIKDGERRINFINGGYVQCRTADEENRLRGFGLDLCIFDEAAFIKEEVWTEAIRPALSDKNGKAIFISTPKGRNWFFQLHHKAKNDKTKEYQAWTLPTSVNPLISPAELEALRNDMPEAKFRQEHLAEFLDNNFSVFRNFRNCIHADSYTEPLPDTDYLFSVDWGKQSDYTVICIFERASKACIHIDRFNLIDYTLQIARLQALYEKFLPFSVVAEQNSIGVPIIEQLERLGMPVQPFVTSHASKKRIIESLALAFEQGTISIPHNQTLLDEIEAYEVTTTPSGLSTYSAPIGMHDDCVMSLAIGWSALNVSMPQLASISRTDLGI